MSERRGPPAMRGGRGGPGSGGGRSGSARGGERGSGGGVVAARVSVGEEIRRSGGVAGWAGLVGPMASWAAVQQGGGASLSLFFVSLVFLFCIFFSFIYLLFCFK